MTTQRLGEGRYVAPGALPDTVETSVHQVTTADGATCGGVLHHVPGSRTVVTIMHPRTDMTHHALVAPLLAGGCSVWTQGSRSVGNDLTLVHEQAILDVAAGMALLRDSGYESIVVMGHSGGGALYAFYIQQATRMPGERIAATPAGRPVPLADARMPVPDGAFFLAPHPGQGELLLSCIDPSVVDEHDPMSVDPALDPFSVDNGFAEPPQSSSYSPGFLERYRTAQRRRVARIDARAFEMIEQRDGAKRAYRESGEPADRRRGIAPQIITVYRTDADPRTVDLSLDPSGRPYGSVFGTRPDITNYGLVGFGRLTTPDAWLSTWSGLSSRASFARCGPEVTVPTLLIAFTGDQIGFPGVIRGIRDSLGALDLTSIEVPGQHFGAPIRDGEPTGASLAAGEALQWLARRFPLT